LWEQGKFKQFLDFVKRREKNGYDSYFEAAMACLRSGKTTWHGSSLAAPKSCASH
jgi:hypothetical protein